MIRQGLAVASVVIIGCGGAGAPRAATPERPSASSEGQAEAGRSGEGQVEAGRASYYADSLAGRPTASGEPYDPRAMTAAHRTLPLGSIVEVARADGRAIRVRINDRGPFGDTRRIVDLSRRAATELGILEIGVADVTLRVVVLGKARRRRRH